MNRKINSEKKTPKCKEKKATQLGQKKTRNSCPTEPMAARDNGGKNECVFWLSVTSCGVISALTSGGKVIPELVVPIVNEREALRARLRYRANLLSGIGLL